MAARRSAARRRHYRRGAGSRPLAAYRPALRGDTRTLRVVVGSRVISALLGLPAFFTADAPNWARIRGRPHRRHRHRRHDAGARRPPHPGRTDLTPPPGPPVPCLPRRHGFPREDRRLKKAIRTWGSSWRLHWPPSLPVRSSRNSSAARRRTGTGGPPSPPTWWALSSPPPHGRNQTPCGPPDRSTDSEDSLAGSEDSLTDLTSRSSDSNNNGATSRSVSSMCAWPPGGDTCRIYRTAGGVRRIAGN